MQPPHTERRRQRGSYGTGFYYRSGTWDNGVDADGGVASQRETKVLLPPVDTNDPEEEIDKLFRFIALHIDCVFPLGVNICN